jgi:hypothetical protein
MTKKIICVVFVLFLGCSQASAKGSFGSAFGSLATARAIGQGNGTFGFGVGVADATSAFGTFTYGLSQYTDGRLKLGLYDPDGGDSEITFGADFKWQLWSYGQQTKDPFDLALGGLFEFIDIGNAFSVFQVGVQSVGSYPVALKNGRTLTPYGRFNLRLESISFDTPTNNGDSESNLRFGLNGGVAFELSTTIVVFGEFQIDGNDGLFFGLDLNVM